MPAPAEAGGYWGEFTGGPRKGEIVSIDRGKDSDGTGGFQHDGNYYQERMDLRDGLPEDSAGIMYDQPTGIYSTAGQASMRDVSGAENARLKAAQQEYRLSQLEQGAPLGEGLMSGGQAPAPMPGQGIMGGDYGSNPVGIPEGGQGVVAENPGYGGEQNVWGMMNMRDDRDTGYIQRMMDEYGPSTWSGGAK